MGVSPWRWCWWDPQGGPGAVGGAGWAGGALDTGWMDGQVDGQTWQWPGSSAALILRGGTLLEATAKCPFRCSDVQSALFCDPAGDPGVTLWSDWRAKTW